MERLHTQIDPRSAEFAANAEANRALVARLRATREAASAGGGAKALERHQAQGKLFVRDRLTRLLDPGSPFLELSPLAALRRLRRRGPRRGTGHGRRARLGTRGADRRQRRDREGRHLLPVDGEETSARPGSGDGQSPALRLPGGLGRRIPADAGRGLPRSRPLRPHLLQPGSNVGGWAGADCRGDGFVHGRWRVRAGDVGPDGDCERDRHHLSRRPAARESRHW